MPLLKGNCEAKTLHKTLPPPLTPSAAVLFVASDTARFQSLRLATLVVILFSALPFSASWFLFLKWSYIAAAQELFS
ncbi:hypothetical protein VNO80_02471 [Phaseolus coccineus]|uniref:Uncharacterized protein n=1 Tax=Phaseolus coccineus TaxID=3886 RepID=A0AAN9NQC8_PHACN